MRMMMISLLARIVSLPMILSLSLFPNYVSSENTASEEPTNSTAGEFFVEEVEPAMVCLFPSFTLVIGVMIFFILSRYITALPYTGVLFLFGVLMGIISSTAGVSEEFSTTIGMWTSINSEVLLLVFLPGLIFKDSSTENVHLFFFAMSQILIFAFPYVLAGAALTALVAFYIFPFGWSFNLAMTFGSILSATDPVAVSALLDEVGAPPRLKVHIGGESLINDGSAMVFFTVFSARYYYDFGIPGFGEDVDLKRGIAIFCQKSLGGFAVGLFFGFGLLGILYIMNRRFNREENVVQVTAMIGVAYLTYYVADFVWETSGVIATMTVGLLLRFLGRAMINDPKLLDDFLSLIENILNTLLFTLGGALWGVTIADGEKRGVWQAKEWGYLILLFVLLHIIRFVIFFAGYPITIRIGLKTNWQETLFQVYGGLRGAVGIALAISLSNEVAKVTGGMGESQDEIHAKQLFAMVGGTAFLTLVVNGPTAGPLLRKLGLADSTEARKKLVAAFRVRLRAEAVQEMVSLLCQERFKKVNFALVKHHIPYLADLTVTQLLQAVETHKDSINEEDYYPPHLSLILPYLQDDTINKDDSEGGSRLKEIIDQHASNARKTRMMQRSKSTKKKPRWSTNSIQLVGIEKMSVEELRLLFLTILRQKYDEQIQEGVLDDNHVLSVSLDKSLDFATDAAQAGKPLNDWETLLQIHTAFIEMSDRIKRSKKVKSILTHTGLPARYQLGLRVMTDNLLVERSLIFMAAHKSAQAFFSDQLLNVRTELSDDAKLVLEESQLEYGMAQAALDDMEPKVVELAISHKFCKILLTRGVISVEHLADIGLMKASEAEPVLNSIEACLQSVTACTLKEHPDEIKVDEEECFPDTGKDLVHTTPRARKGDLLMSTEMTC